MLSPDLDFSAVGARSGIDYRADFEHYKKVLIKSGKHELERICSFYNCFIFDKQAHSVPRLVGSAGDSEGDEIIAALQASSSGSDSEDDLR